MITPTYRPQDLPLSRTWRLLTLAVVLLTLLGFWRSNSAEQLAAYLFVLFASIVPGIFWIRMGARGIPVLSIVSLAYIPYFALPILRNVEITLTYTPWEIMRAALTVVLFLVTATVGWVLIASNARLSADIATGDFENERVTRLVLIGIWIGAGFVLASSSGLLGWLGTLYGLARAITGTLATAACFLSGVTRAQGILRGKAWAATVVGLSFLVLLNWSSLFLVGGLIFLLATLFGYVIVTRRIPWLAVAAVAVAVTVLHAGKPEMRERYWDNSYERHSLAQLPRFMTEWVGEGIYAMSSGSNYQSPLDRTGLMHMLLLAQTKAPDRVDYLRGETYALLPGILVPRFIESDKPFSGVGMELLNVRFGLFNAREETLTSVGWGLVAEAYANYGYVCVAGIALALGVLLGALYNWSVNAPVISMPTLFSIATLMALINVELDFIQLCSIILQSFAAVLVFHTAIRSLATNRNARNRSSVRAT